MYTLSMPCAGWPMTLLISQMENILAALNPATRPEPVEGPPEPGSSTCSTRNTDVPAEPEPTMPDPDPLGPDLAAGRPSGDSPSSTDVFTIGARSRLLRRSSEPAWRPAVVRMP
jgi:hypothetical protein